MKEIVGYSFIIGIALVASSLSWRLPLPAALCIQVVCIITVFQSFMHILNHKEKR